MPINLKAKRDERGALMSHRDEITLEGTSLGKKENPTDTDKTRMTTLHAQLTEANTKIDRLDAQIEVFEAIDDELRALPMYDSGDQKALDPKCGFAHVGEFYQSVRAAGTPGMARDGRLDFMAAALGTYGAESPGADGGDAVPPEFSAEIRSLALEEDAFLPMCDNTPISGNNISFPNTEVTPWGTTGAQAAWVGEAVAIAQSKPAIGLTTMRLNKLGVLVPMTDELIADAPAVGARMSVEASQAIRYKSNDAIVNGTGTTQPDGYMLSGALVTVAAEGGQTADTIVAANVANMWSRQLNPMSSFWVISPDAWPQLLTMVMGSQPIWTPPASGFTNAPGGFLLGRPIISSDTHQTLGDLGDISFVNFGAYSTIQRDAGVQTDMSIHLWFDQVVTAFRFVFRLDGKPWLTAPVTPPNSAVTRSPFVTLAARA